MILSLRVLHYGCERVCVCVCVYEHSRNLPGWDTFQQEEQLSLHLLYHPTAKLLL